MKPVSSKSQSLKVSINPLLNSQLNVIDFVQPSGKTFISMTMNGGFAHAPGTIRQHYSSIKFGIPHYTLLSDPSLIEPCDPSVCAF